MERREFLKKAVVASAVIATGKSLAVASENPEGKELLRLKNKENPSVLEQKHVPVIESPNKVYPSDWFDVKVKVGFMKEHPSTPKHWITMIKLLIDGKEAAETDFKVGGVSASSTTFKIRLEKASTLEAVENCNLHGTWISEPVKILFFR